MCVEYNDVAKAARELKEEGIVPTVRAVQAKLGVKAHSYIAAYLRLWHLREQKIAEASELPEAFLEDVQLLVLNMWSTMSNRDNIRENLLLQEIERIAAQAVQREADLETDLSEMKANIAEDEARIKALATAQAAQREADWELERSEMKKKETEDEASNRAQSAQLKAQADELAELKAQCLQEQERAAEALASQKDAEALLEQAEAKFNSYVSTVQSEQKVEKDQLANANSRVAQLEFEAKGLKDKVADGEARLAVETVRFDTLFQSHLDQSKGSALRKSRAVKAPPENT